MNKKPDIPAPVKAAINELYSDGAVPGKIIISHIHEWDGGFVCGGGYPGSEEEFDRDLTQMTDIFYDIINSLNAERIEVFPIGNSFFEHWQDVMDHSLSAQISKALKEVGSSGRVCLDPGHKLVRMLISGAFNYLVSCAFLISENAVVIPTHNFEFHVYCPGRENVILDIAAAYQFAEIYT